LSTDSGSSRPTIDGGRPELTFASWLFNNELPAEKKQSEALFARDPPSDLLSEKHLLGSRLPPAPEPDCLRPSV
jgi:hypothetical protein